MGGIFWASFCKIGCFTLGATAINSLSWGHTFSALDAWPSKNRSKNNDTPRVIIVYNTINNGTKYPGGYFEPAIKRASTTYVVPLRLCGRALGPSGVEPHQPVETVFRWSSPPVILVNDLFTSGWTNDESSPTLNTKRRDPDRLLLGSFQVSIVPLIKSYFLC